MRLQLVIGFSLVLLVAGYSQKTRTKKVSIEPYMSSQNYEHFRTMVFNSPNSEIEYLEGFDYEWGYRYTLKVRETKLKSYLSDGTRYEYEFIEIVNKERAKDTVFKLFISPTRYYYELPPEEESSNQTLIPTSDSTYNYMDKVEIVIPTLLRDNFKQMIESKNGRLGYFEFAEGGKIRLVKF